MLKFSVTMQKCRRPRFFSKSSTCCTYFQFPDLFKYLYLDTRCSIQIQDIVSYIWMYLESILKDLNLDFFFEKYLKSICIQILFQSILEVFVSRYFFGDYLRSICIQILFQSILEVSVSRYFFTEHHRSICIYMIFHRVS